MKASVTPRRRSASHYGLPGRILRPIMQRSLCQQRDTCNGCGFWCPNRNKQPR